MKAQRRNHYDVTDTVQISHPGKVCQAVCRLLETRYPGIELDAVRQAFDTFGQLYAGTLPGYRGCDTLYHDAQHSLDCSLALARLIDGHDASKAPAQRLGPRRAVLGLIIALFHDAGYVRRTDDTASNGAEYTLTHVRRSAAFIAAFLPTVGLARDAELAARLVHFTGYEMSLDAIAVNDPLDRQLGFMIGTADILAQTADRCYLEKCRDFLYREFEIAGLAGEAQAGGPRPRYPSVAALLENTPDFNRHLWDERLDGYFGSVHRYMEHHFGGRNPYLEQIREHIGLITRLGRAGDFEQLTRRPRCIDAPALRKLLGLGSATRSGSGVEPGIGATA